MILMDNLIENEELNIASSNLPNEFFVEFSATYTDSIHSTCHLWLFPYSENQNTCDKDIGTYFSDTEFSTFIKKDKKTQEWETQYIKLKNIPNCYDFIDIYAIGYSDRKIRAIIQFSEKHRNERKEIFSYQKSYEILTGFRVEGITSNILLGTIGRVSDGWKFYPKLQPCELNKDKIIFLYKERMS